MSLALDSRITTKPKIRRNKTCIAGRRICWLEQLAKSNAFSNIGNPSEWQRQLRKDRQLAR